MDYVNFYKLKPADRIVVPKSSFRIVQHHVIYLGCDHYGRHVIAENVVGNCVRIVSVDEFFANNPTVTRIVRFLGDGQRRKGAVQRALRKVGAPYNLINYNCEHFANEVQYGRSFSLQVGKAILILFAFVFAFIIFKDSKR